MRILLNIMVVLLASFLTQISWANVKICYPCPARIGHYDCQQVLGVRVLVNEQQFTARFTTVNGRYSEINFMYVAWFITFLEENLIVDYPKISFYHEWDGAVYVDQRECRYCRNEIIPLMAAWIDDVIRPFATERRIISHRNSEAPVSLEDDLGISFPLLQ